ncbi:MAG: polysaccharide deacetylase family protein [Gemmataceae bacterium]
MFARVRKRLIQWIGRSPLFEWGVRLADAVPNRLTNLLRVLTYHRIDDVTSRGDLDPSLISSTPEQFATQVRWLSRDWDLVSLDDVLAAVDQRKSLPKRAVLLTFDDAYQDFGQHAWPILRERGVPATVFVPTGFPDEPKRAFWWDRLYCAVVGSKVGGRIETRFGTYPLEEEAAKVKCFRSLKQKLKTLPQATLDQTVDAICLQRQAPHPQPAVMGWDELQRLARAGVSLVPHTHTHPLLDRISLNEARDEILRSRDLLEEKIGSVRPAFAYPSGHFDGDVAELVRTESFGIAFTTVRGINDLGAEDPVKLRRANVGRQTPDALVKFQLTAVSRLLNQRLPKSFAKPLVSSGHVNGLGPT